MAAGNWIHTAAAAHKKKNAREVVKFFLQRRARTNAEGIINFVSPVAAPEAVGPLRDVCIYC